MRSRIWPKTSDSLSLPWCDQRRVVVLLAMSVEKPARRLAAARALRWRATKWLRAHPPAPTLAGRQTQFDADQRARHDKADATGVGSGGNDRRECEVDWWHVAATPGVRLSL